MNYDLDKFGLSEEELFSPVDNSSLESEKITAPRYSCLLYTSPSPRDCS